MYAGSEKNEYANKILLGLTAAGTIPLFIIFGICEMNPDLPLLNQIYSRTLDIPSVTSSFNPVMTKIMDMYCKSAPFQAIIYFMLLFKMRQVNKITDKQSLLKACVFSPFVYGFYVYFFLLNNLELTTAGRPLKLFAESNITLLILYIILYITSLGITYGICYVPILANKLRKE